MGQKLKIDLRPAIEMMGLENLIQQVGAERVIDALGKKRVMKLIGLDYWIANLSPAERREAKRRLQQGQ